MLRLWTGRGSDDGGGWYRSKTRRMMNMNINLQHGQFDSVTGGENSNTTEDGVARRGMRFVVDDVL